MNHNLVTQAIEIVGLKPLADGLDVSYQAIRKWEKAGYMPRTEWTGETDHSSGIERLTKGKVKRKALLAVKPPPKERPPKASERVAARAEGAAA